MKKTVKEYIITYRTDEHYEVLGWVKAPTVREAVKKARRELKSEIDRYGVINATIAVWQGLENIRLNDS